MPGHFFAINRTTDLSDTVGRFYELFMTNDSNSGDNGNGTQDSPLPVQYSLPYHDLEGGGLVVSISQAFRDNVSAYFRYSMCPVVSLSHTQNPF